MRSYLWMMLVVLIVAAGVLGWSHRATAAGNGPLAPGVVAPGGAGDTPIVTVLPGVAETTYEQDPFNQTLLRRSTMKVKTLLVVHADGRVETKQVQ
jgi:hypothetical protein